MNANDFYGTSLEDIYMDEDTVMAVATNPDYENGLGQEEPVW